MKKNRIYFGLLILALVVTIVWTSAGMLGVNKEEKKYSVSVIVNDSNNDRWIAMREGLEQAAKDDDIQLNYVSTGVFASEDEEKAYQEIRNKFGTDVVKLSICLNNMKFDTMNLNEDKQIAEMYYTYNEKTIAYFINMPYRDNSWGVDFEDPIEKEYTKKIEDCSIEVTIYKLKESKKSSCVAKFKYDNIEYLLMGTTTQEEFEKILKSLVFPK